MAEATLDENPAADVAALQEAARAIDVARMRQIGGYHFAMLMGAITLWGAATTWAQLTGWTIAEFAAIGGALVAGFVVPSTLHEWGHFAGARLSGAKSPVLEEPRKHFFMFDFDMKQNDATQFVWMSWGGILAPWIVVLLALMLVPLSITSGAVLVSTLVARAVGVVVFEGPIAQAVSAGGEPTAELTKQVKAGGLDQGRKIGSIVGFVLFALLWLVA